MTEAEVVSSDLLCHEKTHSFANGKGDGNGKTVDEPAIPKSKPERDTMNHALPDYLEQNLDMVFIGINPGFVAAETGKYYAGSGNHFWSLLYMSGLVDKPLNSDNDFELPKYGIGLTNIVERTTKGSADLSAEEIKAGSEVLLAKLQVLKPKIAVFNGKEIYKIFSRKKEFNFGKQPEPLNGLDTLVYVMPNSSARCAQLPKAMDKLPYYEGLRKLRDYVRGDIAELDESEVIFCGTLKSPAKRVKEESLDAHNGSDIKQEEDFPPAAKRALDLSTTDTTQGRAAWIKTEQEEPPAHLSAPMGIPSTPEEQQQMINTMLNPNIPPSSFPPPSQHLQMDMARGSFNYHQQQQGYPPTEYHQQQQHMGEYSQPPAVQQQLPFPVKHSPSPSLPAAAPDPELIGQHIAESVMAVVQRCKDGTLEFPEHYIRPSDPPTVKHHHQPTNLPSPHHSQASPSAAQQANQILAGYQSQAAASTQALENYLSPYLQQQQYTQGGNYQAGNAQWPPGFYDYLRQGNQQQQQQQQQEQQQAQFRQQQQDLYGSYFGGGMNMMYSGGGGQQPPNQGQPPSGQGEQQQQNF